MYEIQLKEIISQIKSPDTDAQKTAQMRLDSLAKPPGSLGRLEEFAVTLAGIFGEVPKSLKPRCVIITASDNGVVDEGVASAPQKFTITQTVNFIKGLTGVCVTARLADSELMVADLGIKTDAKLNGVIDMKIAQGTCNIAEGPAMSREECAHAMLNGIELVRMAHEKGCRMVGAGEMGIGNTTTSSAVLCALTGYSPEDVTGKGAGLSNEAFDKKLSVISRALGVNAPNSDDPIDVISKVGGFDIAAMAGVYIGAAYYRIPAVIDGFISMVSALCAYRICDKVRSYMIPSHYSAEKGNSIAYKALGIEPVLNLGMRLGEGSGCPLSFTLADNACALYHEMATFTEACVDTEYLDAIDGFDK